MYSELNLDVTLFTFSLGNMFSFEYLDLKKKFYSFSGLFYDLFDANINTFSHVSDFVIFQLKVS